MTEPAVSAAATTRPDRRDRPANPDGAANPERPVVTDLSQRVPAATEERLAALLEQVVARRGIHHANFAICRGDGTAHWSGATGDAGPHGAPLTPQTPFFVASITKRFIITLVLQAHERGELHLDDPITRYLDVDVCDGLHVRRGTDHTGQITIRHLASHTAGLPDYFEKPRSGPSLFAQLAAGHDRAWSFEDVVTWTKQDHRPHFAPQPLSTPRQRARYADTGFQLLIRIVEVATSRSYAQLLTERIIGPLALKHTWLPGRTEPVAATPTMSWLYAKDVPLDVPLMMQASNDLISTTEDLLRFNRALLAGSLFAHEDTVALLTERANRLRNALVLRYGLGTMLFSVGRLSAPGRRPVRLIGHSGATGTWLFHCPELDLHLAGTIDQAKGQSMPFRLMASMLRAW